MKKRHTETAARATAVLLTAATLASGTVMEAPTTWAVEQNQNPNASETQNTIRERLEQAVKDASARKDIQSSTSGAAYTADTYGTFEARLTEAQNILADQDASDSQLQKALDALDTADKALRVSSWTVDGVALSGEQSLTAEIEGRSSKPESLTAVGSDGTKVDLSIGGADVRHPAFGLTEGMVTATAPRDGTRPAISVRASWSCGQEITAYGQSFRQDTDGTWIMSHDLPLDADNNPSETTVTVAGQSTPITWDVPTADNGVVSMSGKAEGSVDGQNWRIDFNATRAVDHAGLDQAVAAAKATLSDTMHEYTAASRRTLDDAIGEAEALGDAAPASQYTQAAAAITKAEQSLVPVVWTVDINGAAKGMTRHDDGSWTLDTGTLDQALSVEGGHKLTITSNDPTLGSNGRIILDTDTWKTAKTNDPTKDPRIGFGQWIENGSAVLSATSKGRTYTVTSNWTQMNGAAITNVNGSPVAYDESSQEWTAALSAALDRDGQPAITSINLDNGEQTTVKLSYGKATGSKKGILTRTAVATGELEGSGQKYRITVTASSDTATARASLSALVESAKTRFQPGAHHWTGKSVDAYKNALSIASNILDADDATVNDLAEASTGLSKALDGLEPVEWSTTDGVKLEWSQADDSYHADVPALSSKPDDTLKVVSNDGGKATLTRAAGDAVTYTDSTLGVTEVSGAAHWTGSTKAGRPLSVAGSYDYRAGKKIDVTGGSGETLEFTSRNGYLAANTTSRLDAKDKAELQRIDVDGVKTDIVWSNTLNRASTDTTTTITRKGKAEGDVTVDGHTQHWVVYVTASRVEGRVASLSVIESAADGSTTEHTIDGFDENRTDYTLTLDYSRVSDRFTLGYKSASSDDGVTQGDAIAPTLGADAARILKVRLNGRTYTVTVRFTQPKPVVTNTAARLSGIYVNRTGKAVKGDLIEGWNPDVLTYTLTLGANDPGVYVLPEAPSGVTVKASDVKQTAYSTEQAWTSTAANGETRTYTVRVVRDHADKPTADERFSPAAPKDMDGTTPSPSQSTTDIQAAGYLLDGRFVKQDGGRFNIPEGGVFAYKSYAGQTVQVSTRKTGGMTYEYTLNVLAPDGVTFASHTVTATYVQAPTHKALLDGILIDNTRLGGFDPSRTEYSARVSNLDHWTVAAVFDKDSGMSVTIHKERAKATLTVTSADGLVSRVYVVNLTQDAVAGKGTDGVGVLSETGSNVTPALLATAGALLAGLAGLGLHGLVRRRHRGND